MGGCLSGPDGIDVGGAVVSSESRPVSTYAEVVQRRASELSAREKASDSLDEVFEVSSVEDSSDAEIVRKPRLSKRKSRRLLDRAVLEGSSDSLEEVRRSKRRSPNRESLKQSLRKSKRIEYDQKYSERLERRKSRREIKSSESSRSKHRLSHAEHRRTHSRSQASDGPMLRSWDRVQKVIERKSGESESMRVISQLSPYIDSSPTVKGA